MLTIRPYDNAQDRAAVIALWRSVFGYATAHNDPETSLDRKLSVADRLLFVAEADGAVVGTAMAGYDGHRGWLYSIAVDPGHRRRGLGSQLVRHAEQALLATGCLKINLQLLASNEATVAFYAALGYAVEPRVSMGKVLPCSAAQPAPASPPAPPQGLVVFAKDTQRVSLFYQHTLGLQVVAADRHHQLLRGAQHELVIHAIPAAVAKGITIAEPPEPRDETPLKPSFVVASLADVRAAAQATGGYLKPYAGAWHIRGYQVLDGWDPEGNIVQFKQAEGAELPPGLLDVSSSGLVT
jgi:ribosomal protein S18 acetylase RimI-like enzyme